MSRNPRNLVRPRNRSPESRLQRRVKMARKQQHAPHESHDRWLVSYADFITLLFAFFVVMYASSQSDKAKAQQVSDSVKQALEKGGVKAIVREILGGTVDEKGK